MSELHEAISFLPPSSARGAGGGGNAGNGGGNGRWSDGDEEEEGGAAQRASHAFGIWSIKFSPTGDELIAGRG